MYTMHAIRRVRYMYCEKHLISRLHYDKVANLSDASVEAANHWCNVYSAG